MVNPVVTFLFDAFIIGGGLTILGAMVREYRASRGVAVGHTESLYRARQQRVALARRTRRSARLRAA